MNIEINKEQVEQAVVSAILESGVGERVKRIVEDEIKKIDDNWKSSVLRDAIIVEIKNIIISEMIQKNEQVRTLVKEQLTDKKVSSIITLLFNKLDTNE